MVAPLLHHMVEPDKMEILKESQADAILKSRTFSLYRSSIGLYKFSSGLESRVNMGK